MFTFPTTLFSAGAEGFGNYLDFDGVNDYLSLPTVNLGTGDFTLCFWLKIPSYSSPVDMVLGNSGSTTEYLWYNNTNIRIRMGGVSYTFPHGGIVDNNWHQILYFRNGTTLELYIDGVSKGSATTSNLFKFNLIGSFSSGNYMYAGIDELGALVGSYPSTGQISSLYNSGNYANFETVMGSSTAYFKFNESGTDTIAADQNGVYDATLNNFPSSGMWKERV